MSRPRKAIVFSRPGSANWHFYWCMQGVVVRGSCGTSDKRLAEEIALKARAELIERVKLGNTPPSREMTIDEALERYWVEYASHIKSARAIFSQAKALLAGLGPARALSSIDDATIAGYAAARLSALPPLIHSKDGEPRRRKGRIGRSPATVNRELVLLGAILKRARQIWNVSAGTGNVRRHLLPEPAHRETFLDQGQAMALVSSLVPHAKAPVMLALMTGLRRGNVLKLDWDKHVSLSQGRITVTAKGDKRHSIALAPDAIALLSEIQKDPAKRHGRIFRFGDDSMPPCPCIACVKRPGQPIESVRRAFQTARVAIGLPHLRFHDLRHTFASWILGTTGNLKLLRELLGHADITTTDKYAHLILGSQAREIQRSLDGFQAGLHTYNTQSEGKSRKRKS